MLGDMLRGGLAVTEDHAEADAIVRNSLGSSCLPLRTHGLALSLSFCNTKQFLNKQLLICCRLSIHVPSWRKRRRRA